MANERLSCGRKRCLGHLCTDVAETLLDPQNIPAKCRTNLLKDGALGPDGLTTRGQAIVEEIQSMKTLTDGLRETYRGPLRPACITIITRSSSKKVRPSGLDSDGYRWGGHPNDR